MGFYNMLKYVEGEKRGKLLPIFNVMSRHYSGVATIGTTACMTSASTRTTEGLRACVRASLRKPVATSLLGHSVATENSLSRQRRLTLCRDKVFGVATRFWAAESRVCCDTHFCVPIVALQCETGVCRDRVPFCRNRVCLIGVTTQSWCRDRTGLMGGVATERVASVTEHSVRALCTQQTCDSTLCCVLFGSLFMDTIHEHYS